MRTQRITEALSIACLLWLTHASVLLAADHPGNVHVAGEEVTVTLPGDWGAWHAVDVDGQQIAQGAASDPVARLGRLPVGYYEIRQREGGAVVTAGVVAKNVAEKDTPIALDTAISWFYAAPEQIKGACTLCRLAGVHWVRDRLSWPEIETARGVWADETRYERAMRLQHEAGLKILQVNHISPPWSTENPTRFPEDLRVVYDFYRGLAKRWKGLVDAIEPWNEPDIKLFGGHTGCEIASFQKAAYLGLKAGDPQLPACQSVFAIDRPATLDEFAANEPQGYFDTYNLHHYVGLDAYPRAYGRHRAVSGGRPMWTTEFNLPVLVADEATREPSEEELRVHAFRVGKVFATALHEGPQKAFYFILGDYVERGLQFGLVHGDLTPRPAYVAMAAVGRFLNGAQPLGRADLGDDKLKAYVFQTHVDGQQRETIVAWSETAPTHVEIPGALEAYDYLGRRLPKAGQIELTRKTVYVVLPRGGAAQLAISPAREAPPRQAAEAPPVVLQLLGEGDVDRSAFRLVGKTSLRLVAYNFAQAAVRGRLELRGATGDVDEISLEPGEQAEYALQVSRPGSVEARLDLGDMGQSVVFANITALPPWNDGAN